MKEQWKPIPGHDGYEASSLGRVRSIDRTLPDGRFVKGSVLKPKRNKKKGRQYVSLGRNKTRSIAVCVAMAFLGHNPNGLGVVVDHIDDDCTNDSLINLQLVTNRANIAKGYSTCKQSGLPTGVSKTLRNKKPFMASIYINGKSKFLGTFYTAQDASKAYQKAASGDNK